MSKRENEEQLEAAEINEKPRLVITKENFYVFNQKGQQLTLNKQDLEAVQRLQEALSRNDADSV